MTISPTPIVLDRTVPVSDALVANNADFARHLGGRELPAEPRHRVAIVACMDARLDVHGLLGLETGDAHVIRNAGGVVTDDVIRSLCLSQRLLGTREIMLIHHTDCELQHVDEASLRADLEAEVGVRPNWSLEAFHNPYDDVRHSIQRLYMNPFVPHKEWIRGFVHCVGDGLLREVSLDGTILIDRTPVAV